MLQADCDFSVRLVHASAADLDLDRLRGSNAKKLDAARYINACCKHMY